MDNTRQLGLYGTGPGGRNEKKREAAFFLHSPKPLPDTVHAPMTSWIMAAGAGGRAAIRTLDSKADNAASRLASSL